MEGIMKTKKEKRTTEVRVIVQPSMFDKLNKMAGEYRTISEVVREILVKYLEEHEKVG